MANFCPNCGNPAGDNRKFCAFCGAAIGGALPQETYAANNEPAANDGLFCVNCGKPFERDWKFCHWCGVPAPKQNLAAESGFGADSVVCGSCGAPLGGGGKFCMICGAPASCRSR